MKDTHFHWLGMKRMCDSQSEIKKDWFITCSLEIVNNYGGICICVLNSVS